MISSATSASNERPAGSASKLYFGNLHYSVSEGDILLLTSPLGRVQQVHFLWHKVGPQKGVPKGFCFVDMSSAEEALKVIQSLDGKIVKGRPIKVRHVTKETDYHDDTDKSRVFRKRVYPTSTTQQGFSSGGFKGYSNANPPRQTSSGLPEVVRSSHTLPGQQKSTKDIEDEIRRLQSTLKKAKH